METPSFPVVDVKDMRRVDAERSLRRSIALQKSAVSVLGHGGGGELNGVGERGEAPHRSGSGGGVAAASSEYFEKDRVKDKSFEGCTVFPTDSLVSLGSSDGSSVELEPIDFVWTAPTVVPISGDTAYKGGQKGAIVEFFGWPHSEIAKECEFLADAGYMGAKFFPSQEQVMSGEPFQSDGLNPWYFMYQPVSYKLAGRMGSRNDLRSAVHTCRSLGVRAYADAVLNHMVGGGNDANPKHEDTNCNKWGNKSSSGAADWHNGASSSVEGASPAYTQSYVYEVSNVTGLPPSQEFPAVPWGPQDFHCERVLNSWTDPLDLNAGWLEGLVDLNTERESVQQRLADYLSDLVGIGFSGVRIDVRTVRCIP